ncbi:MAG: hypothetical protein GY856_07240 [bacterium]|nr:hypothetical protein [bacterium]
MSKALTLAEPTPDEATELQAGIARSIAEIEELREQMRRDQAEIEESSARTDVILNNVLAELTIG